MAIIVQGARQLREVDGLISGDEDPTLLPSPLPRPFAIPGKTSQPGQPDVHRKDRRKGERERDGEGKLCRLGLGGGLRGLTCEKLQRELEVGGKCFMRCAAVEEDR